MPSDWDERMKFVEFLKGKRRLNVALFWTVLIAFLWWLDTMAKENDIIRLGYQPDYFRLYTAQISSGLGVLVMVFFVVYWCRRYPLTRETMGSALVAHVTGSFIFTLGHYGIMMVTRELVFALNGMDYNISRSLIEEVAYEYFKDIKIYLGAVAFYHIGLMIFRPDDSDEEQKQSETPPEPVGDRRLLVQTRDGKALIVVSDIEYVSAAKNYVALYAGGVEYLVRETFSNICEQLAGGTFERVHRSHLVNLDHVERLRNKESGSGEVVMKNGTTVPLSRRWHEQLSKRFTLD